MLRIEVPGGLTAWRELTVGDESGVRKPQPGVVLRQDSTIAKRLAEPESVRLVLDVAGHVADFGGTAITLAWLAKRAKAMWVKINGKRVDIDEAKIKKILEDEQDVIRLIES